MADGGLPSGTVPRRLNLVTPELDRQAAAIVAEQERLAKARAAQVAADMADRMKRPPSAGLGDEPLPKAAKPPKVPKVPETGPTVSASLEDAIPKTPALPGPRISPVGNISTRDVYAVSPELSIWDRVMGRPAWDAAREEVGKIRTADAIDEAKPAARTARLDDTERQRAQLEKDASRLGSEGRYKEAAAKQTEAENLVAKTSRLNYDDEVVNEGARAREAAAVRIAEIKADRAKMRLARLKSAKRTGLFGLAAVGAGAAITAGVQMYRSADRSSPDGRMRQDLMLRYLGGESLTPEEETLLLDDVGQEAFGQLRAAREQGLTPTEVEERADQDAELEQLGADPVAIENEIDLEEIQGRAETGDPDFQMIDYRKPEIADVPSTFDPQLFGEALKSDPLQAEDYRLQAQLDDEMARSGALYDAGVENFLSAAGAPEPVMDLTRAVGQQARGEPVDEFLPDGFLKRGYNVLADGYASLRPGMQQAADQAMEGNYSLLSRYAPQAVLGLGDMFFGGNADEMVTGYAGLPYNLGRDAYSASKAMGSGGGLDPLYNEAIRSMGGETLLPDPLEQPGSYPPADQSRMAQSDAEFNAGQPREGNTGVNNQAALTMEDLVQLEAAGALGNKPDGTPYTAVEMMRVITGPDGEFSPPTGEPLPPSPTGNNRPLGSDFMDMIGLGPGPWQQNLPELTPLEAEDLRLRQRFSPTDNTGQSAPSGLPPAPPAPPAPGGGSAGLLDGLGAAMASELPQDDQITSAVRDVISADEVRNPRGQMPKATEAPSPVPAPAAPAAPADIFPIGEPVRVSNTVAPGVPVVPNPSGTTGQRAAASGSSGGTVGDFKASREAGLSDDAEAAEKELNWINRQMRDKLGLDATQRNYLAQALIAGGGAMMSSDGDFFDALGEGLQAGAGAITAAKTGDLEAQQAQLDMQIKQDNTQRDQALDAVRLRVEQARLERGGKGGSYADTPAKIQELDTLTDRLYYSRPGLTYEQAAELAMQMVYDRQYVGEGA